MLEGSADSRVRRFWELFERQEFFESHEVLEELWMASTGPERNLYKGLIQIAVSLHHLGDGNLRGARKVFDTARALLEPYQPSGAGVRLDRLVQDARDLIEQHERATAGGPEPGEVSVNPLYEPADFPSGLPS
ncbi:MAG: DUF309 domain-containing protein [Acidobacteriota bacterium]